MSGFELKSIEVVCQECGISRTHLMEFIFNEWIVPADTQRHFFDEEDLARVRLIAELRDLEVGEAAIPIILNLIDQVHVLRKLIRP